MLVFFFECFFTLFGSEGGVVKMWLKSFWMATNNPTITENGVSEVFFLLKFLLCKEVLPVSYIIGVDWSG